MLQTSGKRLVTLLLVASMAAVAETVVLRNGFRFRALSVESLADGYRLVVPNGGWVVISKESVSRLEPDTPRRSQVRPVGTTAPAAPAGFRLAEEIERAAASTGIAGDLVRAVAWAESSFDQSAVSPKGAIGLMQLMPATAASIGVDPHDPSQNLLGGARYLREMLDRFEGDRDQLVKALAAYNAGPGRVDTHDGIPPNAETPAFVGRVVRRFLELTDGD